jgi:hypothetical protein
MHVQVLCVASEQLSKHARKFRNLARLISSNTASLEASNRFFGTSQTAFFEPPKAGSFEPPKPLLLNLQNQFF